jgi:hypothetical protein
MCALGQDVTIARPSMHRRFAGAVVADGSLEHAQGQGGFGTVFEATWRGKQVAVKV